MRLNTNGGKIFHTQNTNRFMVIGAGRVHLLAALTFDPPHNFTFPLMSFADLMRLNQILFHFPHSRKIPVLFLTR